MPVKLLNWSIAAGLAVSGALMILGLTPGREGLLAAHFFGYWFGLAACLLYIFHGGVALFRHPSGFWETLTPVNAGLTGMGIALIAWDPSRMAPLPVIVVGVAAAAACAALLLDKYRILILLPLVPLGALFYDASTVDPWAVITATAIFIVAMPVLVGLRSRMVKTAPGQSNSALLTGASSALRRAYGAAKRER